MTTMRAWFFVIVAVAIWCRPMWLLAQQKTFSSGPTPPNIKDLPAGQPQGTSPGPAADFSLALQTVATMLPQFHISRRPLDDEIGRRWLRNFLRALDPEKAFFTQADIDGILQRQDEMDDMARAGASGIAKEVYKVLITRTGERVSLAEKVLAEPIEFSSDDSYPIDYDTAQYAADASAVEALWRNKIKFDLLKTMVDGLDLKHAQARILRRYQGQHREVRAWSEDDILELFLTALARAYDDRSGYTSPKKLQDFAIGNNQQFDGVGIQMNSVDGDILITSVFRGGPAALEGHLRPGDHIVAVGDELGSTMVDVRDARLADITKLTRGKAGTVCRLKVVHKGQTEPSTVSVNRGRVQPLVAQGTVIERLQKADGTSLRIGYVEVPSLYSSQAEGAKPRTVTGDVRSILEDPERGIRSAKIDALILDLRNNGGGNVGEAVALPGLFIGSGPVVQVRDSDRKTQHYDCDEILVSWDGPMIVLTNSTTGSGGELVAAALQDHGRALVVGDAHTAGSGSIQTIYPVDKAVSKTPNAPALGLLKVTTLQFFRVNGDSTQVRGVIPDVILPALIPAPTVLEQSSSPALTFDRVAPIERRKSQAIDDSQRAELIRRSVARREKSDDFRRIAAAETAAQARRNLKRVSLKEQAARQQLGHSESPTSVGDDQLLPPSFYNDELLAITRDYVELLGNN